MLSIPADRLRFTAKWMAEFADYWNEELPLRIHQRALDEGGAPDWHHDFALWLTRPDISSDQKWRQNPEPRVRTTRAFRKLRHKAPREYEVLYRTAILGIPIRDTVLWLNQRAARNALPDRYDREDVIMILVVATEKIHKWF
jgi:hypothetical protein